MKQSNKANNKSPGNAGDGSLEVPGEKLATAAAATPPASKTETAMKKQLNKLNDESPESAGDISLEAPGKLSSAAASNALLAYCVNMYENGKLNEAQWLNVDQIFMGLLQLKT